MNKCTEFCLFQVFHFSLVASRAIICLCVAHLSVTYFWSLWHGNPSPPCWDSSQVRTWESATGTFLRVAWSCSEQLGATCGGLAAGRRTSDLLQLQEGRGDTEIQCWHAGRQAPSEEGQTQLCDTNDEWSPNLSSSVWWGKSDSGYLFCKAEVVASCHPSSDLLSISRVCPLEERDWASEICAS